MSLAALRWAFRVPVEGPVKGVLLALADHADEADGRCFPKIDRIQTWAGCRTRAARLALQRLHEWGLITIEGAGRYVVNVGATLAESACGAAKPARHAPKRVHVVHSKVHDVQPEVHVVHSPLKNLNPQRTPKEPPVLPHDPPTGSLLEDVPRQRAPTRPKAAAFEPPDWVPRETWAAYLAHRVTRRAKPTPYALGLIVKELDRLRTLGHAPQDVLDLAIRSNWIGVFAPKGPRLAVSNGAPVKPSVHERKRELLRGLREMWNEEPPPPAGEGDYIDGEIAAEEAHG